MGRKASRKEILDDLEQRVQSVPGIFAAVGGPLADRIGHMLSGVSAPVAIKVFGPDLDALRRIGSEIQAVAKTIPGFEDAKLDQQSTISQPASSPDRQRAAAYGVAPGELNNQLSALLGGKPVAELREGKARDQPGGASSALHGETPPSVSRASRSRRRMAARVPLEAGGGCRRGEGAQRDLPRKWPEALHDRHQTHRARRRHPCGKAVQEKVSAEGENFPRDISSPTRASSRRRRKPRSASSC